MPAVYIEYRYGILTQEAKAVLKKTLRADASVRFSTTKLTLSPKDFGIKLDQLSVDSEPTHDVVVRIQLHAFGERLAGDIDQEARLIARNLAHALKFCTDKPLDIGVSLLYAEIGWGTSVTDEGDG